MKNLEKILSLVGKYCTGAGHDLAHVTRVYHLAMKICEIEGGDAEIVALASLLHDVDDYKFATKEEALSLSKTRKIMDELEICGQTQDIVCTIIATMGYKNRLNGIFPSTLEGKIVSDADMCDAIGASGIIRTQEFSAYMGAPFFDRKLFPKSEIDAKIYTTETSTSVNHCFDKLLKLKNLMLTSTGRAFAEPRHQLMVDFLRSYFEENNVPEWADYLDKYLDDMV